MYRIKKWMFDYSEDFFAWNGYRIEKKIVPSEGKKKKTDTQPVLRISGESVDDWCENIYFFLTSMRENGYIDN